MTPKNEKVLIDFLKWYREEWTIPEYKQDENTVADYLFEKSINMEVDFTQEKNICLEFDGIRCEVFKKEGINGCKDCPAKRQIEINDK